MGTALAITLSLKFISFGDSFIILDVDNIYIHFVIVLSKQDN